MSEIAIFTIASSNYLAYVRLLMQSLRQYHPDVDRHLILADEADGRCDTEAELYEITEARSIGIDDFMQMAFRYDIMEFNTAVKPFAFRYFLGNGYKKIIYFDPDILLYHNLQELFGLLDRYSIILTPHLTTPLPIDDTLNPSEQTCLSRGTYNLGFLALSESHDARSFCDWWCRKCSESCYSEIETGLFVDQKWINFVPAFWSSVHILRHQGYNVAYWNLHERRIDGASINGEVPLIFIHFSGIMLNDLNRISKYQNRFKLKDRSDVTPYFEEYRDLLIAHGHREAASALYRYGFFDDDTPIGPVARRLYPSVAILFPNPFQTGSGTYHALLKKKRLLERPSVRMRFVRDVIADDVKRENFRKWINVCFTILCRVVGIRFYHLIMNYLLDNASIRKQTFLLHQPKGSNRTHEHNRF